MCGNVSYVTSAKWMLFVHFSTIYFEDVQVSLNMQIANHIKLQFI